MERFERIPVPAIATFLSLLTLSNVYGGLGFVWFRYLVMACGTVFIICYILKIIMFPKTVLNEYSQVIPCSLYAALTMCMMILGSFYLEIGTNFSIPALQIIGKAVWYFAVAVHTVHLIRFIIMNMFLHRNVMTTMPSWFVTLNGYMVACVTGGAMNAKPILTVITIYGCIIYVIMLPIMIWRLLKVEIKAPTYHTMAILLAPCSLCVVSLINVYGTPNALLLGFMYICVVCTLIFIIIKLPDFFSYQFYPGYAGLTFPMAIGIVATQKMAGYLTEAGSGLAEAVGQLAGLQIFLTSGLVFYVLVMLSRMLFGKSYRD
ncbi:MAG: TDT family transporter [Lachnospiraceae bacterium]|nr:TDT family transporter [Lachnospiraceae bacterium]